MRDRVIWMVMEDILVDVQMDIQALIANVRNTLYMYILTNDCLAIACVTDLTVSTGC